MQQDKRSGQENWLTFFALIVKYQKEKVKISIENCIKEYLEINLTEEVKKTNVENTDKGK